MREQSYRINNSQPNKNRGGETKVMKKFLNAILIIALVLTMVTPAFAAAPSDVEGTVYEDAVSKLMALGVVTGKTADSYAPLDDISRKEFAAMIVRATGHESDANLLKDTTPFPDVTAGQWFTGYVAAAQAHGFMKGKADGTFDPNAPVKGSEVLATLLRAAGYNDNLPGDWPYDYILKANELGILDGVDFSAYGSANRGVVAQLTSEALEINLVTYNKETEVFDEGATPVTFIDGKLDKNFSEALVNEPKLNADGKIKLGVAWKAFADDAYVGDWAVGQNVRYLTNADGEITYLAPADNTVVTGVLDGNVTGTVYGLALVDVDDAVPFDGGVEASAALATTVFINDSAAVLTDLVDGSDVTIYLDADDEVRFVVAEKFGVTNKFFESYLAATSYREAKIDVSSVTYDVNSDAIVVKDGQAATLADLAEDDVIDLRLDGTGDVVEVKATTPVNVSGEVTSKVVRSGETYYKVGGVEYQAISGVSISVATEYDFVLNVDGEIISATVTSDADTQDVIVVSSASVDILDDNVVTSVYKTVLFKVDAGTTTTYYDVFDMRPYVGNFGTVTFDADGIDSWTTDLDVTATAFTVSDFDSNSIEVNSSTYAVGSGTVFVNLLNADGDLAPSLMAFEDLKDNADIYYTFTDYNLDIAFVEDGGTATSDALPVVAGLVTGVSVTTTADGTTYTATLNVNGTSKTLDVDLDPNSYVDKLVRYADTGTDGAYDDAAAVAADLSGALTVSDNIINTTYIATSSTVVYVVDADGNISVGDLADIADLDGGTAGTTVDVSVLVAKTLDSNGQPTATTKKLGSYEVIDAIVITLK